MNSTGRSTDSLSLVHITVCRPCLILPIIPTPLAAHALLDMTSDTSRQAV